MKYEFENLVDTSYNTNYIVYNHVVYTHFLDKVIFSGNGNHIKTKCGTQIKYVSWDNNYT